MPLYDFFLERFSTPTGTMLVVSDAVQNVRAADWEDHEERMHRLLRRYYGENAIRFVDTEKPSPARKALERYFEGDTKAVTTVPFAIQGTAFQQQVWNALRRIPLGSTMSYGGLAQEIGNPTAMRAVGLANGSNPIAIILPCHRVIGANGSLTGYGGGIERKRWLLAHEGVDVRE